MRLLYAIKRPGQLLAGVLFLSLLATTYMGATPQMADAQTQPSFEQKPSSQNTKDVGSGTLIRTEAAQADAIKKAAQARGIKAKNEFPLPNNRALVTFEASPAAMQAAIQSSPSLILQEIETFPNRTYRSTATTNDPKYRDDEQWNLNKLQAGKAWDITTGSATTTIAVLDSGVLYEQSWGTEGPYTQPDMSKDRRWLNAGETGTTEDGDTCWTGTSEDKRFNDCDDDGNGFEDDWRGWDFMGGFVGDEGCPNYKTGETADTFIDQDSDPQPYSCDSPDHPTELNKTHYDGTCTAFESACFVGHGTAVASVAAAATDNSTHIAGIDWNAQVMNLRVFDGYGYTTTARLVAAMEYADDMGADVANLSLAIYNSGGSCDTTDKAFELALKSAHDRGVVSVAASGNGNKDYICYPASSKYTISAGATDKDDKRASFSNYGSKLDLVAPGVNTPALNAPSSHENNEVYEPSGTSLSTPHAVGAAALIKGQFPNANMQDTRANLRAAATNVSSMEGKDYTKKYGDGRLNLYRSLQVVNIKHPDGVLVQPPGGTKVYRVEDEGSAKRHIASREIFQSYNFDFSSVRKTTPTDSNITEGSSIDFREGTLVQDDGDPVYVINYDSNGAIEKRHITSKSVFQDLGYSFSEVLDVNDSALPSQNGQDIDTASIHPDGTLIQKPGNSKVFRIENGERRHIISREVFKSHYFKWVDIKDATESDMELVEGSLIDFREGALVQGSSSPVYAVNYDSNGAIEKRHITSREVFDGLGFSFEEILEVNDSQLPSANGTNVE